MIQSPHTEERGRRFAQLLNGRQLSIHFIPQDILWALRVFK